jgi:hypothetical protein
MGPKNKKIRQATKLLVTPCELPVVELPTPEDVLGMCTSEKEKIYNNSRIAEVLPVVIKYVKDLYNKVNSNLVLVSDQSRK